MPELLSPLSHLSLTSLACMMTSQACMSSFHLTPHTWRGLQTRASMRQPHAAPSQPHAPPSSSRLALVCSMPMLAPPHITPHLTSHLTPHTCGVLLTWRAPTAHGVSCAPTPHATSPTAETLERPHSTQALFGSAGGGGGACSLLLTHYLSLSLSLALSLGCSLLMTQLGKEAAHLLSLFIASLRNDSGTQFACFTCTKVQLLMRRRISSRS
jgi:hypothetical protein